MKLYKFQKEALEKVQGHDRVAFYLDMGLGKTFVGAEQLARWANQYSLVVCQKSKIQDWIDHFTEHYPDFAVYNGRTIDQIPQSEKPVIVVINYDLLYCRGFVTWKYPFKWTLLLDESSLIQNYRTLRWKTVKKMNFSHLILLSGTPVSGKYERLFTQIQLLNPADFRMTMHEFWERYVIYRTIDVGFPMKVPVSYKNVNELKKSWLDKNVVWRKTSEVLELPQKRFIDMSVPADSMYKRFMKNRVIEWGDEELIADNPLVLLTHGRRLCAYGNEAKMERFAEILESTESRLIVFYNFTEEMRKLRTIAQKHDRPVSVVSGTEKNLKAYEKEENSVTFVQYQAGAMGLNLQKANKLIFASPTLSCDLYMQAQKRIHRIGQLNACTYFRLFAKGTVEEKIYAALERGEDYTEKLFEMEVENGT